MAAQTPRFQHRRGSHSNLPNETSRLDGELLLAMDRNTIHMCVVSGDAPVPVVPDLQGLQAVTAVDGANDLLLIHDDSQPTGVKEKKVTVQALKDWMGIPEGDSDEKVAAFEGQTPGYLYVDDAGTNVGVLRGDASIQMESVTPASGLSYVILRVGTVDCGTF